MGMKVVLGVGDKSLEKYITEMPEVDVLTTVRRREGIIDAIVNYNPHAVILSMALPGKADYSAENQGASAQSQNRLHLRRQRR